jgi:hypothetical protein
MNVINERSACSLTRAKTVLQPLEGRPAPSHLGLPTAISAMQAGDTGHAPNFDNVKLIFFWHWRQAKRRRA